MPVANANGSAGMEPMRSRVAKFAFGAGLAPPRLIERVPGDGAVGQPGEADRGCCCTMTAMDDPKRPARGPGLERTITLVDAVVAIAMTLLVLPLVDVAGDVGVRGLGDALSAGRSLVLTFVISFVVIFAYWGAHGTIYSRLRQARRDDLAGLSTLNLCWLLVIAFLPFPTALIGHELNATTVPIYLATLLVLSVLTLAMIVLVHRAAGLPLGLAWLSSAVFAAALITSFANPHAAMYLLLLLFVTRLVEERTFNRAVHAAGSGASTHKPAEHD